MRRTTTLARSFRICCSMTNPILSMSKVTSSTCSRSVLSMNLKQRAVSRNKRSRQDSAPYIYNPHSRLKITHFFFTSSSLLVGTPANRSVITQTVCSFMWKEALAASGSAMFTKSRQQTLDREGSTLGTRKKRRMHKETPE